MSAARVVEGLLLLDGLVASPSVVWLATAEEKFESSSRPTWRGLPRGTKRRLGTSSAAPGRARQSPSWYFKQRRAHTLERAPIDDRGGYDEAHYAFGATRFQVLYRRWLMEGDTTLEGISSGAVAEAIKRGGGCAESHVLPFSYRHLSPPGWLDSARIEGGRGGGRWPRTVSAPSRLLDSRARVERRTRHSHKRLMMRSACATRTWRSRAALAVVTTGGVLCRPPVAASGQRSSRRTCPRRRPARA